MDSVELVKKLCKEKKIPISKLETSCGFGNGYIRKLKEGKFPSDRLVKIAEFLNVTTDYLLGNTIFRYALYADLETILFQHNQEKNMSYSISDF